MSGMALESIESDFRAKVSGKIRLSFDGVGRFRVFTPFFFEDGDHLVIVLKRADTGWILSDEGFTYTHLAHGMDASALSAFHIEDCGNELVFPVTGEQFGDALYSFVQALMIITTGGVWNE